MKNFIEELDIKGHLQISKKSDDGSEEILFDDHNIIVSGMGLGLSYLFSQTGSDSILDFQIDKFQVGVDGSEAKEIRATNRLGSPLSSITEYGDNALLYVVSAYHQLTSDTNIGPEVFGYIPTHKVSRVGERSVRYTITLDKQACNLLERGGQRAYLDEIGLFMKNPSGVVISDVDNQYDQSVLVAYRYFSPIEKTEDFSLIFRWTINW